MNKHRKAEFMDLALENMALIEMCAEALGVSPQSIRETAKSRVVAWKSRSSMLSLGYDVGTKAEET